MQFRNPIEIGFKLVQLKVFRIMDTPILLDMMSYCTYRISTKYRNVVKIIINLQSRRR